MSSSLTDLFSTYALTEYQRRAFHTVKATKNMPTRFKEWPDEEIVWAVAVATIGMPDNPTESDKKFYTRAVEQRVRRLEEAETIYGWFTLKWTPRTMQRLITNWYCGMLVIDPELQTASGAPIQFVREFYGPESKYPQPEGQDDEWKKESVQLYVLMARSICLSYPTATTQGIVSLSDMQNFDWAVYDMSTKERNANIGALIPNKLKQMIVFNPDEKMRIFYKDMTRRMRKKYGFAQYEDLANAMEGESSVIPSMDRLPNFMGGRRKVDIFKCLKYLFRREPDALNLLMKEHAHMEASGAIPHPIHMQ